MPEKLCSLIADMFSSCVPESNRRETNFRPAFRAPLRLPRRRAVIIGINYVNAAVSPQSCVADARALSRFLRKMGFPSENQRVHCDAGNYDKTSDATRSSILRSLSWLASDSIPGDQLFLYFAGQTLPPLKTSGSTFSLVPQDFSVSGVIPITALLDLVAKPLPRGVHITILFDCKDMDVQLGWSYDVDALPYMNTAAKPPLSPVEDASIHFESSVLVMFTSTSPPSRPPTQGDVAFPHSNDLNTLCCNRDGPAGLLASSFLAALQHNPEASCYDILSGAKRIIGRLSTAHRLMLSASRKVDLHSPFNFGDCMS
eukprot:TRINITY_DN95312_c0_g1_i1.p1 TRINITY_DN95312_c0_g1~~TRINITY_DN95312_c0_g1_i1.p1  ORF type:complete len:314 (-),score=16.05 TRINITY_DN95312_c0_g1_i1:106-1047(-)